VKWHGNDLDIVAGADSAASAIPSLMRIGRVMLLWLDIVRSMK